MAAVPLDGPREVSGLLANLHRHKNLGLAAARGDGDIAQMSQTLQVTEAERIRMLDLDDMKKFKIIPNVFPAPFRCLVSLRIKYKWGTVRMATEVKPEFCQEAPKVSIVGGGEGKLYTIIMS